MTVPRPGDVPLSLYVHVPWCVRKCPYCDFNSHALSGELPEQRYVDAVLADVEADAERISGRNIRSVFIGGGTPSLLSGKAAGRLLEGIAAHLSLAEDVEITLEANPGAVDAEHFSAYRTAGVNRLSIGIQSLDARSLLALGRVHDPEQAREAFRLARRVGFDNINLDIMFGLPGQDQAGALADLRGAMALEPEHLSWYQLTIEPNTLFHHRPPRLPDDESLAEMQEAGQMLLAERGYARYEVSAYAREGFPCRHNLNYWQFGDYLAAGAGAHGKLSGAQGVQRFWRARQPQAYMAGGGGCSAGERWLSPADLRLEFMMNALRLEHGVPLDLFSRRTGLPEAAISEHVATARARGLLDRDAQRLCATPLGKRFLNDLLVIFDE
ncbi:radical SAM family heme chaperone HemW [Thiolapillus sp.]